MNANSTAAAGNNKSQPCWCCGNNNWWVSIYGQRICRVCHPPAVPSLEVPEVEPEEEDTLAEPFLNAGCATALSKDEAIVAEAVEEQATELPAMYVAHDLDHWITDEPHLWADKVSIDGKEFVRVTPEVIAWLKGQIAKAEAACNAGKLPVDDLTEIIRAFCPVYEFAVSTGMVPDPVPKNVREQAHGGSPPR